MELGLIVVIDDDESLLDFYSSLFEIDNIPSKNFSNFDEALQFILKNKDYVSGVITDYQMPGYDVESGCRKIVDLLSAERLCILSGDLDVVNSPSDNVHLLEKPCPKDEIISWTKKVLRRSTDSSGLI